MLSALSAWTRRQHAELGGSGRSWGTEGRSKSRGDGRTFRGRLDADLLWTRARRATHCDAIVGGDSGGVVGALPAGAELAVAAYHCGFLGGRWADLFAAAFGVAGSWSVAADVSLHGAPRVEAECDD